MEDNLDAEQTIAPTEGAGSQPEPTEIKTPEEILRIVLDAGIEASTIDWTQPDRVRRAIRRERAQRVRVWLDVTSEAYVDLLKITVAMQEHSLPTSYDLEKIEEGPDEQRFSLLAHYAEEPDVAATVTLGRFGEEWKITALKIPGIRE